MSNLALKEERTVARYVPYSHHVTEEIIACRDQAYLAVIKVGGRSADAADIGEQHGWIEALHNVLRGLPLGKLGFYSHIVRRHVTEYPKSSFPQVLARQFDEDYRASFDKKGLMINELYLSVLVRHVSYPVFGLTASLEKESVQH